MDAIRLVVVDDHTLFRRGLMALLGQDERFRVVGEAADAGEALRCTLRERPDLVLLDNHLPGATGIDTIRSLKEASPGVAVLMLTVSEDEEDLVAALRNGADGFLLKTTDFDDLAEYILRVQRGELVVSAALTSKLVAALRPAAVAPADTPAAFPAPVAPGVAPGAGIDALSAREREILARIVRGASNKVIARELGIAETTVKIHVQHILRKLGLTSRVQAAVYAAERGLAPGTE